SLIGTALSIVVLLLLQNVVGKAYTELNYNEKRLVDQLVIKVALLYFLPALVLVYLILTYPQAQYILFPAIIIVGVIQLVISPIYLYKELKKLRVSDDFYNAAIGCLWIMILYTVIKVLVD